MPDLIEAQTERLRLRQWQAQDKPAFAVLNADPEVMRFFHRSLTPAESDAMVDKAVGIIAQQGWGFWAVEEVESQNFIGFVGLNSPSYDLPFSPCVEIGWRLAREYWGKGYASEAARAALKTAFTQLDLTEVVAFTTVTNQRSRAVMERINMTNTGQNFEYPLIPPGHPLREHVLYKISRGEWLRQHHERV